MSDSNHTVRNERLAGRYSYLEREGLLPLPVQDGITVVVELRYAGWAGECLNLLQQHSGPSVSLIGVAMDKDFPLKPLAETFPGATFIPYDSGNYGVNEALAYALTSFVVLIEDSVMVTPCWVGNLLWPFIDDPSVQVVAPRSSTELGEARERLHFGTEQELSAYVAHSLGRRQGEWHEVPVLCGSCLVFTRELVQRTGGFDSTLFKRQLMVADWCLRARQRGARLVLSDTLYVHSLQPLLEARARDEHEAMQDSVQAYLAKWGLDSSEMNVEEGILPIPPDVSVLPPRPGITLEKSAAPVPLVTAVVYSEKPLVLTPEESCEFQRRLQGQQSYGNIRWVWIRDSRRDAFPEFPVREQDAVIAVQGEDSWLHALENVAALYGSEIVVYLSASGDYDSHYIKRIAEAVLHGSADLVVSRAASAMEEPASHQGLTPLLPMELPLERIAHRSGIVPGRITRQKVSGHGLQLEPKLSLAIGYIGGPPEANILTRRSGGEVRL